MIALVLCLAAKDQRELRAHLPPLALVPPVNTASDANNATIPPPNVSYEPVYLTDAEIVNLERIKRGGVVPSHDAVEADKVGTR